MSENADQSAAGSDSQRPRAGVVYKFLANSEETQAEFEKQLAREQEWEARAQQVQGKAAQAYLNLIELAERSDTGQARRVARFLASTYNGERYPFDLFDLRGLDVALSDEAIICIDALRWGRADLYKLLPDGARRIADLIISWGINKS